MRRIRYRVWAILDWDEEGWQSLTSDPEVPAIFQEAGLRRVRPSRWSSSASTTPRLLGHADRPRPGQRGRTVLAEVVALVERVAPHQVSRRLLARHVRRVAEVVVDDPVVRLDRRELQRRSTGVVPGDNLSTCRGRNDTTAIPLGFGAWRQLRLRLGGGGAAGAGADRLVYLSVQPAVDLERVQQDQLLGRPWPKEP
jgi:hypothetical protein